MMAEEAGAGRIVVGGKVMAARPIVVGADASWAALQAVEWAAREAARRRSLLRIVSVTTAPPWTVSRHGVSETVDDVLRNMYAQQLQMTAERAAGIAPGLAVETRLRYGTPTRALVNNASDASMLVVGAGGCGDMGVGPVSGYVATHAACPVVVVRDQGAPVHGEIVVGVRDADEAASTLGFAFEEAALRGARLHAVHAWYWFPPALSSPGAHDAAGSHPGRAGVGVAAPPAPRRGVLDARALSAEAAVQLSEVLNGWQDKYPGVQVRHDVVHGHPGSVLAAFSGLADLVVVGRRGGHDGIRLSGGSVQHAVLSRAQGPVVVVPPA